MSAFDQLAAKLAERKGGMPQGEANAIAAKEGRKKYGASVFNKAAAQGVPAASVAKRQGF